MEPLRTILAATDFSSHADHALARALQLARGHDARLHALHVVDFVLDPERPPGNWVRNVFPEPEKLLARLKQEAETALSQRLAKLRQQLAEQDAGTAEARVAPGVPFVEIIRTARALSADLIVLGAHGRNFIKDLLLGTSAERVVRKGDRPVLVVKTPPKEAYRRVLVALDFSDTSRRALAAAVHIAPAAHFALLHVYDFAYEPRAWDTDGERLLQLRQQYEPALRTQLETVACAAGLDPRSVEFDVRYGYPAHVIPAAVKERNADLVAVGTSGVTGLRYVLLGSVAEHVLREAPADVLAVPPPAHGFELP